MLTFRASRKETEGEKVLWTGQLSKAREFGFALII